jgi:hypothetical protein
VRRRLGGDPRARWQDRATASASAFERPLFWGGVNADVGKYALLATTGTNAVDAVNGPVTVPFTRRHDGTFVGHRR